MDPRIEKKGHWRMPLLLSSALLICTMLLSACSSIGNQAGNTPNTAQPTLGVSPTLVPSPTVSPTLAQQGTAQLQTFQQWITLMQQYNGNITTYQQQYTADQQALSAASTNDTYQHALDTLKGHVNNIKLPALRTEAVSLQQKLSQGAADWEKTHTYHDDYDGVTYNLGYEYAAVVNYPAQGLLDGSETTADYQYIIEQLQGWEANFEAYKSNFSDQTPYNKVHQTDTQLIARYGDTADKVIVVSLSEQAMRVYQNGKLVQAFQVVTGMPGHPSLPGTWWIENRQTNIQFTSGKKPGQDGYYPPTPIAFALQYHSGGYFIHQSWWRSEYGPNMQFPHVDNGGTSFAFDGSHGCVNMSTSDVSWLYNFAQVTSTKLLIY